MIKRRKMRLNGEWSLLAGNRVYELKNNLIFNFSCIYDHPNKSPFIIIATFHTNEVSHNFETGTRPIISEIYNNGKYSLRS